MGQRKWRDLGQRKFTVQVLWWPPTTEGLFKTGLVLVSVLLIGATAWWSRWDFEEERGGAEAKLGAAAMVVKGHAVRSLSAIDMVLASVAELVERDGLDSLHTEPQLRRLRQIAHRLPQTGEVFVADHFGNLIAASASGRLPSSTVSDREWFRALSEDGDDIHIGQALRGRSVHGLFFPVARALRDSGGALKGAVQVGVEVSYLAELLRDLELSPGAWLGLYRSSDGAVIARHPMTEAMVSESIAPLPFFSALGSAPAWTGWLEIDGEERLVSARQAKRVPVIAVVSIPKREVYAGAWRRLPPRILVALMLWGALFGFTVLAVRQAQRESYSRNVLSASEARFREMADHAPMMVWVTEPDHGCSFVSRSWYEFTGQAPGTGLGRGWEEAVSPHDRTEMVNEVRAHSATCKPFQVEYRLRRHDGVYRWVLAAAAPRFDDVGAFLGYIGSVIDISERKEAEIALAERDAQLALAGKAARVGGWFLDAAKDRIQVTDGYAAIYHLPAGTKEISVEEWRALVHPDDIQALDRKRARSFAERQSERRSEYRIVRGDGAVHWIESRGFVAYDSAGRPLRMVGVSIDITERKQAEERQQHLLAELDHRVKNILAKIVAMVERTLETCQSADDFGRTIQGRIRSMANTHALLSRNHWHGVSLGAIVRQELASYGSQSAATIEGPEVRLVPEASQGMAAVLHELATNAAKYGALSVPGGHVTVRWGFADGAIGPARLALKWEEHGGPPVGAPARSGFGTRAIRGTVSHQLDGRVDLIFDAAGVRCTIELPLSRVEQGAS